MDDARFDHPDGIGRLLSDLEVSFGEKEIFRQGGSIREFESIGRMQGESITACQEVSAFRAEIGRSQGSALPRSCQGHQAPRRPSLGRQEHFGALVGSGQSLQHAGHPGCNQDTVPGRHECY